VPCDKILLKCIKYKIITDILHFFSNYLDEGYTQRPVSLLISSFKRGYINVLHVDSFTKLCCHFDIFTLCQLSTS